MKIDKHTIVSILSSYNIKLTQLQLDQLEHRIEGQQRLLELINAREDMESFALAPKWALLQDKIEQRLRFTGTQSNRSISKLFFDNQRAFPLENVGKALDVIESNPEANVFIKVFKERALKEAEKLEHQGSSDLPLYGTTAAVKDLIAIEGHRMTGGSVVLNQFPSVSEALVVRRLRKAGTVIIGAANLHELAFGTTNINSHFGTVVNPVNKSFLAGGSSGGSAAAVKFGMASFALGTDTGGSVRIPAACCGIVGFKPSFNLIPLHGVLPLGYTLDHIGVLTLSVKQAALVSEIMVGQPGLFSNNLQVDSLKGLKIGAPRNFFVDGINEEVKNKYYDTLHFLEKIGAKIISVSLPLHSFSLGVYLCTSGPEALGVHFHRVVEQGSKLGNDVYIRLLAALFIPAYARVRAQRIRYQMYQELQKVFNNIDVLATPTLPITVPEKDTKTQLIDGQQMDVVAALLRNTSSFNLTGVPAITIPVGPDKNGLPISLQLACPYGEDHTLLKISSTVEQELQMGQT